MTEERIAYNKLYVTFWADVADWSSDEVFVALYLLLGPERRTEGLFQLHPRRAAADLGDEWTRPRVEAAFDLLEQRSWMLRDGQWILLVNAMRWDPPRGIKTITGAVRKVALAPRDSFLWERFLTLAAEHAPEFHAALLNAPSDAPSNAPSYPASDAPSTGPSLVPIPGANDRPGLTNPSPIDASSMPHRSPTDPSTSTSTSTSTSISTSISTSTSGGGERPNDFERAAALQAGACAALRAAGFGALEVDQDRSAIGLVVAERSETLPDDVDWDVVGQQILRGREEGTCNAQRPSSALRWRMRGLNPLPRQAGTGNDQKRDDALDAKYGEL